MATTTEPPAPSSSPMKKSELKKLKKRAKKVLRRLITHDGIYASTNNGWKGSYHSWFGRDTAITADLVFAADSLAHKKKLAIKTYDALQKLAAWQGVNDDPETGEEKGKFPHEIRSSFDNVDHVQHAANTNALPWFIDPLDGSLKNWDSADSTPLWIIVTFRGHKFSGRSYDVATLARLRSALEWCVRNLEQYDGLASFLGADNQPGRIYSGLHNQGWKDSFQIYQYPDGSLAKHPVKDVLVNAEFWAALEYGADVFEKRDATFAEKLRRCSKRLKHRFNDPEKGFLIKDRSSGLLYFAEALDGDNRKLEAVAADVALCLWAYHEGESIIDKIVMDDVVKRIMSSDMFNPGAGIRNYSLQTTFKLGTSYHGSPYTYWPFVSALIVRGLDNFGYKAEARALAAAMLRGVAHFHSAIELFVETPEHGYALWSHPTMKQQSASNQAWTAAGIYYATRYLLK